MYLYNKKVNNKKVQFLPPKYNIYSVNENLTLLYLNLFVYLMYSTFQMQLDIQKHAELEANAFG